MNSGPEAITIAYLISDLSLRYQRLVQAARRTRADDEDRRLGRVRVNHRAHLPLRSAGRHVGWTEVRESDGPSLTGGRIDAAIGSFEAIVISDIIRGERTVGENVYADVEDIVHQSTTITEERNTGPDEGAVTIGVADLEDELIRKEQIRDGGGVVGGALVDA